MSKATDDVLAERQRQIEAEGWTEDHDDKHNDGSLADAAACYAATSRPFKAVEVAGRAYEPMTQYEDLWPWNDRWWKPKNRRHDLVRAAALLVAEIERLDRAALKTPNAEVWGRPLADGPTRPPCSAALPTDETP